MIHPSSELETSRWLNNERSLYEVLSLPKIPDHRKLYQAAAALYHHKDKVEDLLYEHFSSKYPDRMRLCLYDLTNFYFEGRKAGSELAQYGHSKEKRKDAKPVSLALLTDGRGFIRRSTVYRGNISEPSTMQAVVSELENAITKETGLFNSKPVVVMDCNGRKSENFTAKRF
jgi:transposase